MQNREDTGEEQCAEFRLYKYVRQRGKDSASKSVGEGE
jgi:hypothetical protein